MPKPPPYVAFGSPALLSEDETIRLDKYWHKTSQKIIANKLTGTHVGDVMLSRTIGKIRDGYFQIFAETRLVLEQKAQEPENKGLDQRLDDLQYDLILLKNKGYEQLITPGLGSYSKEQMAHYHWLESYPGPGNPLTPIQAKSLMGSIIRQSIDAFDSLNRFYQRGKTPRMKVEGQISMLATPESVGKHRSQPRKEWVSDLQIALDATDEKLQR